MKSTVKSIAFAAAACLSVMPFFTFAEVKALSAAIDFNKGGNNTTLIKSYLATNNVDFAAFDYSKSNANGYFINTSFTEDGKNFAASYYFHTGNDYRYFIYNSDKYELVDDPAGNKSSNNMTAVFQDAYGDQFALISLRGSYTASSVKTYIEDIAKKYPAAKLIVTYNARVGTTNAETLNASLTTDSSGPQMTCLGRTDVDGTAIGGVYMYSADVPDENYVTLVPSSIGTASYSSTLATLGYPTKCKVIFNDWDGTGLQTNIVFAGESVTPPVPPERAGYTFTGWDHAASEFASVAESFTAMAQYAENAAWLLVSGDPEEFGTADPAYGTTSTNGSFTASVTATNVLESGVERWVCTGYTHYEITDVATGAKTVAQEGNTASFAYTHVFQDELVWHFTNEWLVTASATAGGSVSAVETWVRNGETLPLVATPDAGYAFWRWLGDTNDIADVSSPSIAPAITAARTLRAVFVPTGADASVQYVAATGDDANSGYLNSAPKRTVQAAVDALAETVGYGTVHVAKGSYTVSQCVAVTNAILVRGATGNPEDVILRNTDQRGTADVKVLYLNHPGAGVANIVIEGGHRYTQKEPFGANVSIDAAGGTVSNCVIRNATSAGHWSRGTGAWLNSDAALLTHCVVTNNVASGSGNQSTAAPPSGLYVHIEKGIVSDCLIADNRDSGSSDTPGEQKAAWSSGVTVVDGRLLNCTVVTNEARYTGGVYLDSNGFATNVVVAGCVNKCTYPSPEEPAYTDVGFKGALANASHCASGGGEALDETCVAGTAAEFFADFAGGGYQLAKNSPLRNKGIEYDDIAEFDLLGKKRVQGSKPDIGCFESAPIGLSVVIR